MAVRSDQSCSQLRFHRGKISVLESLIAAREASWGSAARKVQLQNELHNARERIFSFEQLLKKKDVLSSFEAKLKQAVVIAP